MKKTPKFLHHSISKTVSVIIPYYNGSKWIERALISVYEQSIKPDEVIIVNDGSTLEERNFIEVLSKQYPFILIHKNNGGQGSARNLGVTVSTANYISFLDQDDFYLPHHIENLLEAIPKRDYRFGFSYADLMLADENGNIVNLNLLRQQNGRHPKEGHVYHLMKHDMCILPSASLILKLSFQSIGGFDEQFIGCEDDDLFLRLIREGYSHYFIDKPVTVWCSRPDSTGNSIKMLRSFFLYFKKLNIEFPTKKIFLKALYPRFNRIFISSARKNVKKNTPDQYEALSTLREYINYCLNRNINIIYMIPAYIVYITLRCWIIMRDKMMRSRLKDSFNKFN